MRKLIVMGLFLAWLAVYIVGVASLSGMVGALPRWAQLVFYMLAGIAWVFPLRPLFRWMNRTPRGDR